ncbi:MAG TPA: hypothetical protein VMZ91_10040, partial [Candidatus Paceibacterota bacterium]|nr:hypothetical protein [Candidatus Paceibacterota bacterium]
MSNKNKKLAKKRRNKKNNKIKNDITSPNMRISDIIKGVGKNVCPKDILKLRYLGNDLNKIKKDIEEEVTEEKKFGNNSKDYRWTRECTRRIGLLCEYIGSLGFLLKVKFLTDIYGFNYSFKSWSKKHSSINDIKSILDITAGGNSTGAIDILLVDGKKIYPVSGKIKKIYKKNEKDRMGWKDTDVNKMRGAILSWLTNNHFNSNDYDVDYGVFVNDKEDFKNFIRDYETVKLYDWEDLSIIWKQVYEELKKYKFNFSEIDDFITGEKKPFEPWVHQVEAAKVVIEYWKEGKGISFLLDHICRSGKTLTALYIMKLMGFKDVLLMTSFPSINESEWHDTIKGYHDFNYWNVVDYSANV